MEPDFCPLRVKHHGKVGTQRLGRINSKIALDAEMSPSKQGGRTQRDAGDSPTGYQLFQLDLGA